MTKAPIREELPLSSNTPLPYMAVYRSFLPKSAWIPVLLLMVSTVGLILSHDILLILFFLLEVFSIAAIFAISLKTSKKKKETWVFLDEQHKEFIEAVRKRYGVTLTETILYALAQGGETLLPDNTGQLTRIMIESDSETKITKLVESGKV
jgi:hypothetical protein